MTRALVPTLATAALLAAVGADAAMAQTAPGALRYPETRRDSQVDSYHGVRVADPYRWLEDTDSPATHQWVEAQNALTFAYLSAIPERARLKERLTALWNYQRWEVPFRRAKSYFYFLNDGLQNQSVLWAQRGLDGAPRVLLDPNTLSADGTVALTAVDASDNAKYIAYALSTAGSDWQEIRVRDVATAHDLPDVLKWVKFTTIGWTHDGKGFFYSRYDEPAAGTAMRAPNRFHKLYYHRVGQSQSQDQLIYERRDQPEWLFDASVSEDGQYAVIRVSQGTDSRNRLYLIDLADAGDPKVDNPVVRLLDEFDASYDFIDNSGPYVFVQTDLDAPRGRVVAIDVTSPARRFWRPLIPQTADVLERVSVIGKRFVARYLHDAQSRVRFYTLAGSPAGELALPGIGTVTTVEGRRNEPEMFYGFTSYLQPASVYRYVPERGKSEVFKAPALPLDTARYETRQVFYPSKDGTKVPMFITARKGLARDGNNPTILYAYGGFDISITPSFSPARIAWLEQGGIYAVANLRGGGEYGEAWHQAGMLAHKQTVFDDFIAAAEYLEAEKYTSPQRLAIQGGSNGGLLVGAVMTQRPALMAVALPAVGVMDMLRFHRFTIGWAWVSEYGSADDSTQFATLHHYSPLHNLHPGTHYPATLVTTSDHDDRVVPGHSFKFAAALQAAQGGPAPTLIRVETRAGHGAGKPTSKLIDEAADELGFVMRNLGMSAPVTP